MAQLVRLKKKTRVDVILINFFYGFSFFTGNAKNGEGTYPYTVGFNTSGGGLDHTKSRRVNVVASKTALPTTP